MDVTCDAVICPLIFAVTRGVCSKSVFFFFFLISSYCIGRFTVLDSECTSRVIKLDSKQKKKNKAALPPWHKGTRFPVSPPPGRSQLLRPPHLLPFHPLRTKETNKRKSKTKRSEPFLSTCHRRRSESLLPLLFLLLSCWPAYLRLGVASAPANKDIGAHTPAPSCIGPDWYAASGPVSHLLLACI
jgi:hypothetical protein